VRKVHVPLGPVRAATRILQALPFYPITRDQLTMLEEESVTDPASFYADFHLVPQSLDQGLRRMLTTKPSRTR